METVRLASGCGLSFVLLIVAMGIESSMVSSVTVEALLMGCVRESDVLAS